eukprot:m.17180 g.17180  ORF g.17180 m.17180 type:complete len:931 (-) comp7356_c0_seq1:1525-4317(-)
MVDLSSVGGILSLLAEPEPEVQGFAIEKLLDVVKDFWAEIAQSLELIEQLSEDSTFEQRNKAALLAAQVHFYLDSPDSLRFALEAGTEFNVQGDSLFVNTIIGKAIDTYTASTQAGKTVSPNLLKVVNRMVERCLDDGEFEQAIGIALESRRLDIVKEALERATNKSSVISYCFNMTIKYVVSRTFRDELLEVLAEKLSSIENPDMFNLVQCLVLLDKPEMFVSTMARLIGQGDKQKLLAYQLAFHFYPRASQPFLQAAIAAVNSSEGSMEQSEATRLISILSGKVSQQLYVEFLSRNNHTDPLILSTTKGVVGNNSVLRDGTVLANGLMCAGTTSDVFLRDEKNKDFVRAATDWSKFSVVASIGVIHKGHTVAARKLVEPYVSSDSPEDYELGGGLYALGLICANQGTDQIGFLLNQLQETRTKEPAQHGGALALGLAAMGTASAEVESELTTILNLNSAVAGEAAGIALGLNQLGTANAKTLDDMLSFARATRHEKIIRGLSLGMALTLFNRQEQADATIDDLLSDKDPILRMSGCHSIAMAYAATGENRVVRRLLHIVVSDASDDVRRTASTALGFIYMRTPEHLPNVLRLLCESFSPHVRAGCCMALGIACASTGMSSAIALVEPLIKDPIRYVRQAALISMALILLQQPNSHPKIKEFRKLLPTIISNKHEVSIVRFGAVLAQGILEAGGRNVNVNVCRDHGHIDAPSVVGLLVFTQFWFWFPFTHFLSLALQPTALICLNGDLNMPKIDFISRAKPSMFAYPPKMEAPKSEDKGKVTTAVLSITSKALARQKRRNTIASTSGSTVALEPSMDTADDVFGDKEDDESQEKKEEEAVEPDFDTLANPARVVKDQLAVIEIPDECRYQPVTKDKFVSDIVVLADSTPGEEEELIALEEPSDAGDGSSADGPEPTPPPPFEFNEALED